MYKPLINILTRTSNRPNGFKINVENIKNQTYDNINHIICTDDESSIKYIEESGFKDFIFLNRQDIINNDTFVNPSNNLTYNQIKKRNIKVPHSAFGPYSPHNLYFNEMIKSVNEGWVIYLDDDDRFTTNNIVSEIVDVINNNNDDTLIYWRMVYSNGRYLPVNMGNNFMPRLGGIGGSCFTFNIKYKDLATWDSWKCGDFRVIQKLHNKIPNKVLINKNFIYVPSQGMGRKIDIKK